MILVRLVVNEGSKEGRSVLKDLTKIEKETRGLGRKSYKMHNRGRSFLSWSIYAALAIGAWNGQESLTDRDMCYTEIFLRPSFLSDW